jgi:hypothetical protein
MGCGGLLRAASVLPGPENLLDAQHTIYHEWNSGQRLRAFCTNMVWELNRFGLKENRPEKRANEFNFP